MRLHPAHRLDDAVLTAALDAVVVTSPTLVAGGAATAAATFAEVHVGSSAIATWLADFLKLLPLVAVSSRCCCCFLLLSSRCSCCSWDVVSSSLHHFNNTKVSGRGQVRLYALTGWATGSMDTINQRCVNHCWPPSDASDWHCWSSLALRSCGGRCTRRSPSGCTSKRDQMTS